MLLAFGAAGYLLVGEIVMGGGGPRIEGSLVIVETADLEATFIRMEPVDEVYMVFGGNAQHHSNLLTDAFVAGLPVRDARMISYDYPDFHLCKSPGAKLAQRQTQDLSFVAADRTAKKRLRQTIDLHAERLGADGERTCVAVRGARIALESVKHRDSGHDLTAEFRTHLAQSSFILAESVEIADCEPLLR